MTSGLGKWQSGMVLWEKTSFPLSALCFGGGAAVLDERPSLNGGSGWAAGRELCWAINPETTCNQPVTNVNPPTTTMQP